MNEIKRMQQLAGLITESAFDRVKQILINKGYPEDKITTYCNDLESYGDEEDYENISDEEVVTDFEEYFGELNEDLNSEVDDIIQGMRIINYQQINNLPEQYGVYFWFMSELAWNNLHEHIRNCNPLVTSLPGYGDGWRLVYVGKAGTEGDNLQQRVGDHFSGDVTSSTNAQTNSAVHMLRTPKQIYDYLVSLNQNRQFPQGIRNREWKEAVSTFMTNNYVVGWKATDTAQETNDLEAAILAEEGRCDLVFNRANNNDNAANNELINNILDFRVSTRRNAKYIQKSSSRNARSFMDDDSNLLKGNYILYKPNNIINKNDAYEILEKGLNKIGAGFNIVNGLYILDGTLTTTPNPTPKTFQRLINRYLETNIPNSPNNPIQTLFDWEELKNPS